MRKDVAALGIRFDIDKLKSANYGKEAWRVFWQAVPIDSLPEGSLFFEGDSLGTLNGRERVFFIAVQQLAGPSILSEIQSTLRRSAGYQSVAASPQFVETTDIFDEPLVDSGQIDSNNSLVGKAFNARAAISAIEFEMHNKLQVDQLSPTLFKRTKTTSSRTSKLPNITSLDELKDFLMTNFSDKIGWRFWLTSEELCDIVEFYENIFSVKWHQNSCQLTEDMTYISIYERGQKYYVNLYGLFSFGLETSAEEYCHDSNVHPSDILDQVKMLAGVKGKYMTNLTGQDVCCFSDEQYEEWEEVTPSNLWMRICKRYKEIGYDKDELEAAEKREKEDEQRRRVQAIRKSSGLCIMCGKKLGFLLRIFGKDCHRDCTLYKV